MKGLRYWVVAMLSWLFLLYNVERLGQPINLASFVYVMTIVLAVLIVGIPWLQRLPVLWLSLVPLPVFFALKVALGYPIGGENLPITVTEMCSLWLTIMLARMTGRALEEYREAGIDLLVAGHLRTRAQPFERGQADIYREIQRARLYRRPLSMLAVTAHGDGGKLSLERLNKEVRAKLIQKYLTASLADLLLEQMNDCDIVTQRNDHFVLLLPEVSRDRLAEVVRKLETAARDKLGLRLTFGASLFPEDEVTFEKLLERAEAEMRASTTAAATPVPSKLPREDGALLHREA